MCEWALAEWAVPLCFSDDLRANPQHAVKPQSFNCTVAQSPNVPFGLSGSLCQRSHPTSLHSFYFLPTPFFFVLSLTTSPLMTDSGWEKACLRSPFVSATNQVYPVRSPPAIFSRQFRRHKASFTFALAPMAQCSRLPHAGFSLQWCHAHKVKGHRERCDVIYHLSGWQGTFVHWSCC